MCRMCECVFVRKFNSDSAATHCLLDLIGELKLTNTVCRDAHTHPDHSVSNAIYRIDSAISYNVYPITRVLFLLFHNKQNKQTRRNQTKIRSLAENGNNNNHTELDRRLADGALSVEWTERTRRSCCCRCCYYFFFIFLLLLYFYYYHGHGCCFSP